MPAEAPTPEFVVFDRSRVEAWEHCPRQRYLAYEFKGHGIERIARSVPLLTGTMVHEPLAEVLTLAKQGRSIDDAVLNVIVANAATSYLKVVRERGLMLDTFDGEDASVGKVITEVNWQVEEQLALVSALVRAWVKVRLPQFLVEWDIVAVETEMTYPLASDVLLMARADALLKRKGDGSYFVLNFKTVSDPRRNWLQQWRYDQQTMSEILAADYCLKRAGVAGADVRGVLIEGLVKGSRKLKWPPDADPEQWRHRTPLLYAYKKDEGEPFPASYAAKYEYRCEDSHKMGNGKLCPGGRTHRLGQDWKTCFMPGEPMGLGGWLNWLAENEPELLRAQFVNPPPVMRSEYEIEQWKRATLQQEQEIAKRRVMVEAAEDEDAEKLLDAHFPKHSSHGNCLIPSLCPFEQVCWGPESADDSESYRLRDANHPQEADLRKW